MPNTAQDKLAELLSRCKCGVYLKVNAHRDEYATAAEWLQSSDWLLECPPELDPEVRKTMIDTDTIIELQFYPDTPIGSYVILHYDLDAALSQALDGAYWI